MAWESPGHNVNVSSPGLAGEGAHIVPDGEAVEQSVSLPCEQHASGVGSKLDSADGAPTKQAPSQDASSCSSEEGEFPQSGSFR